MDDLLTRREAGKLAMAGMAAVSAQAEGMPDVCGLSAVEMARHIRARKLSAVDALEAHLRQIERVNPRVNAIVTLAADKAREQAKAADEAIARGRFVELLHGLPVAHKDLQPVRGMRTTFGSRIYQDFVPDTDSLLVERVRNAGAILLGKTNTPEFGAGSQTFNEVFGATRNPYDTSKTCGGSSGGAAVALACRMLPVADGSDLGGSLRNPANFCNVVGMRPSPGRVPSWPSMLGWSTLAVQGPMARSVADVAFFLAALAGPDARDPVSIGEAGARFALPLGRDFKGVRVAWWKDLGGLPVDPRVRRAVDAERRTFEDLGCVVETAEPDFSGADEIFKILRTWMTSLAAADKRAHRDLVKDTVRWEIERGDRLTAADVGWAEMRRTELYHRFRRFMERYEFFVLPVNQVPPFDLGQEYPAEIAGVAMTTYIDWMKSCYYVSLLGSPALSVPCGFTPEGLPVGLQIVGRHHDDFGLLQLGHAYEVASGVPRTVPALAK